MKILQNYKKLDLFILLAFLFSYYWLRKVLLFFIDITQSADFAEYIVYFEHFKEISTQTGREQGLMYYYIHYIYFNFKYSPYLDTKYYLSKSIFEINELFFIFGLIGLYKILKLKKKYTNNSIFLTFIFVNFFPVAIAMRIYFKPEIFAFCLLPWIIYSLEKFILSRNYKLLLLMTPLLASILSLKGSITVMVGLFLLIYFFNLIKFLKFKEILFLLLIFLIAFIPLNIENYKANGNNQYELQSGSTLRENYNNQAPFKVFYNFDLKTTLTLPIKHYHANSFISITLLDTFGDYFDLNWDNDSSKFFKNRNNLINLVVNNEIKAPIYDKNLNLWNVYVQNQTDFYPREILGLILSFTFYFYLIKSFFMPQKNKKYNFAFLIGYFVLFFHTFSGFPVNNFDPLKADTFKTHYYSFLLIISAVFFIVPRITNKKNHLLYLLIYCLSIIYILGLPKYINFDLQSSISSLLEYSKNCNYDKFFLEHFVNIKGLSCSEINHVIKNNFNKFSLLLIKPINSVILLFNFICVIFIAFNIRFNRAK